MDWIGPAAERLPDWLKQPAGVLALITASVVVVFLMRRRKPRIPPELVSSTTPPVADRESRREQTVSPPPPVPPPTYAPPPPPSAPPLTDDLPPPPSEPSTIDDPPPMRAATSPAEDVVDDRSESAAQTCLDCGEPLSSRNALRKHVRRAHGLTLNEYEAKYLNLPQRTRIHNKCARPGCRNQALSQFVSRSGRYCSSFCWVSHNRS